MTRTKKSAGRLARRRYGHIKRTMKGGGPGILSRFGSKLAYGLGRIGRSFRTVEGKFQYNTRHSSIESNRFNTTKIQNQLSTQNNSPFKVYYINKLNRNDTVLNAINPQSDAPQTLNTLPELIHVTASYTDNSVFDKYFQRGYLGYLYKGAAKQNNT
jgi:hypothetical protein